MKPYFSIIIPYHNSKETIGQLLDSIKASKGAPVFEVIIVDDGSEEPFHLSLISYRLSQGRNIRKSPPYPFPLRIIRFDQNKGPAKARNAGAKIARGKFLLFLDGDVQLYPDALHNLSTIYKKDPDVVAVTGVWVKHQKSTAFFPNFKALRDWSYWINERDKSGYYFLFSTRIASIKRAVFYRLCGFDEVYAGPLVEDIEFTYRIARRYAIIFAPNVRVHHEFEGFWPIAKKYFWRTYYWTKLYERRKRFDPVATTGQEAVTALSGMGFVGFSIICSICWLALLMRAPRCCDETIFRKIFTVLQLSSVAALMLHIFLVRKFLVFVYQEKGLWFSVRSFFTGLVLYCFITAGAVWGKIKK